MTLYNCCSYRFYKLVDTYENRNESEEGIKKGPVLVQMKCYSPEEVISTRLLKKDENIAFERFLRSHALLKNLGVTVSEQKGNRLSLTANEADLEGIQFFFSSYSPEN